jgi:hypothetical protein
VSEVWFRKVSRNGRSGLMPTDAASANVLSAMKDDECKAFEPVAVRDPVSFKRFWHLMEEAAKYVTVMEIDRIGKQPVLMRVFDKDSVCRAIKFCIGHYDTMPVGSTDYAIREARSINFRKLKQAEWAALLPKVYDVLLEQVAPEIADDDARDDFLKCIEQGQAQLEAQRAVA